jgi:four helix bundle protein
MHDYRRLDAWSPSQHLVLEVYNTTFAFPADERLGLTRQLRRAAVSIPSNRAEEAGRASPGDFARFIRIAIGSACEVETQLDLSLDLAFLASDQHRLLREELREIKAMLRGLERSPTS